MVGRIKLAEEEWRGVYINGDMDRKMERVIKWMGGGEEGVRTIIGGDFNARTGREESWVYLGDMEEEERKRKSKNLVVNKEEKRLLKGIGEIVGQYYKIYKMGICRGMRKMSERM